MLQFAQELCIKISTFNLVLPSFKYFKTFFSAGEKKKCTSMVAVDGFKICKK